MGANHTFERVVVTATELTINQKKKFFFKSKTENVLFCSAILKLKCVLKMFDFFQSKSIQISQVILVMSTTHFKRIQNKTLQRKF